MEFCKIQWRKFCVFCHIFLCTLTDKYLFPDFLFISKYFCAGYCFISVWGLLLKIDRWLWLDVACNSTLEFMPGIIELSFLFWHQVVHELLHKFKLFNICLKISIIAFYLLKIWEILIFLKEISPLWVFPPLLPLLPPSFPLSSLLPSLLPPSFLACFLSFLYVFLSTGRNQRKINSGQLIKRDVEDT